MTPSRIVADLEVIKENIETAQFSFRAVPSKLV
jgi:hypothetical protein